VRRKELGRDPELTVRMCLALVLLIATYGAIVVGIVFVYRWLPSWWPYWTAIVVVLAGAAFLHYRDAEGVLLRSAGARVVSELEHPDLYRRVERLAAEADIAPPKVAIIPSPAPNAFAVGLTQARATVALGEDLLSLIDSAELDSVIAHEVGHVANRDAAVLTAVSIPRTIGSLLATGEGRLVIYLWFFIWPVGLPLWAIGTGLTLTLSRYREFEADRASALLTGRPQDLMSALQKLTEGVARIPDADLRVAQVANAFYIVPVVERRWTPLMDHPPLAKRLERLATIAREMGKPV
jgi:heat shock protein HtpX